MAHIVILPKQGLQMTEGTIMNWLVDEGGACIQGEPLFEMETDKLVITIDAPHTGTLLKILQPVGSVVPITRPIAVIGEPGEDLSGLELPASPPDDGAVGVPVNEDMSLPKEDPPRPVEGDRPYGSTPRARMEAGRLGVDVAALVGSGPDGLVVARDVRPAPAAAATPLARAVAAQQGVDLAEVPGSGPYGKRTRRDVEDFAAATSRKARRGETRLPMSGARRAIAKKMRQSLDVHAQLFLQLSVDMTEAEHLRREVAGHYGKVSYNDIVLLVTTRALLEHPVMNGRIEEGQIVQSNGVHMGVAVAVEAGLVVPVLKHCERYTLLEIAEASRALAQRAKTNVLLPDDCAGGSFTVSNLGMYGIESFNSILNTPESGILSVGAVEKRPVVREDEIVVRPVATLNLTYDHRIVDGAPAAQFLLCIKRYLEAPYLLL